MYVHSPYFKTLILLLDFSSAHLQCKCELYGAGDLCNFPSEKKSISTLLLHTLKNVGSMDPQVALLLLC